MTDLDPAALDRWITGDYGQAREREFQIGDVNPDDLERCPECGSDESDGLRNALGHVHPELLRCSECDTIFWPGGERA